VQQIRQPIDTENENLKAEITKLRSQHATMSQQRDHWESNARYVQEQLQVSENERHAIIAKFEDLEKASKVDKETLDTTRVQLRTSESARTKIAQEMDDQKDLLQSELEGFKSWVREKANLKKELEDLRGFEIQFRQLAASRKDIHSTM
jgi:chromosome segregation ATPase